MAGFNDPVLPPEIWREILARLPVRSVLRCRSVCKSWYSLISCSDFISLHITNSEDKSVNRVLLHHESTFSSHDVYCMESREHDQFLGRELKIVGSCNGLICFSELGWYHQGPIINSLSSVTFLIWNPAIRKTLVLPSLTYRTILQHCSHVGFGWDPKTSDCKVMCNVRGDPSLGGKIRENVFEVFDLSKGVWRSISPLPPSWIPKHTEAECYVNGAVYWSKISDRILLSFNMTDECFREVRMPDCADFIPSGDGDDIETQCVAFGGLLHLIVFKMYFDDYLGDSVVDVSKSCSIWAMKECGVTESWIKVSNIDLPSAQVLPRTQISPRNFLLWAKGEVLMMYHLPVDDDEDLHIKHDLVLYNSGSGETKRVFSITKLVDDLCLYKESLVLM